MNAELLTRVAELRDLRAIAAEKKATIKAKYAAFDAEHAIELQTAALANDAVVAAETALKAIAAAEYEATGEAKPCPGIAIQQVSTLDYVESVAFTWCKQAGIAITPEALDKKGFEVIAKATPLSFVTYSKTPRVTISTDLDKALASVGAATAEASV